MDHGWEIPPPPPQNNNDGWGQWIQQEGELVAENELAAVDHLVEIAVANAVMQHLEHPQHSVSVSSDSRALFRAQGPPVTLELPLPATAAGSSSANRVLELSRYNVQSFNSDFIRSGRWLPGLGCTMVLAHLP